MFEVNRNPSRRELRQFSGIWFPAFFAVVGGLIAYRTGHWTVSMAIWAPALVLSVMGLVRPDWMRPIYVGWMLASAPIGWVVSRIILAIVYYLVITPIGLVIRLTRRDPLGEQFDPSAATYWVEREQVRDTSRYFRQF